MKLKFCSLKITSISNHKCFNCLHLVLKMYAKRVCLHLLTEKLTKIDSWVRWKHHNILQMPHVFITICPKHSVLLNVLKLQVKAHRFAYCVIHFFLQIKFALFKVTDFDNIVLKLFTSCLIHWTSKYVYIVYLL
jgi:hypothetical protein